VVITARATGGGGGQTCSRPVAVRHTGRRRRRVAAMVGSGGRRGGRARAARARRRRQPPPASGAGASPASLGRRRCGAVGGWAAPSLLHARLEAAMGVACEQIWPRRGSQAPPVAGHQGLQIPDSNRPCRYCPRERRVCENGADWQTSKKSFTPFFKWIEVDRAAAPPKAHPRLFFQWPCSRRAAVGLQSVCA